ncbi:MAG: zinc-ribbon domain-containing protein [Lachnospiraceae bacterium]|nr:zinc-ribbon domain-containing protein [Lachnospiraceae bacterium]
MFCPNCGSKLEDGVKFCPSCGNKISANEEKPVEQPTENNTVEQSTEQPVEQKVEATQPVQNDVNNNTYQNPNPGYGESASVNTTNNGNNVNNILKDKRVIAGIVAAVVVVVGLLFFFLKPTTVNLDKYIMIESEGYNSVGTAKATFNKAAFAEDYRGKIKINKKALREEASLVSELEKYGISMDPSDGVVLEMFEASVSNAGKLDKTSELKNGDTVTYDWSKLDKSKIERCFKVKIKAKGVSHKVSGLEKVKTKDIFKGVSVKFYGRSGHGYGRVSGAPYNYYLKIEDNSNLKNGDTVTVEVESNNLKQFIKRNGFAPKKSKKTFKVSGLTEYISDLKKLNDKQIESIKKQTEEYMTASFAKSSNLVSGSDGKYLGMYLQKRKDSDYDSSTLYVVYSYTVTSVDGRFDPVTLYMPLRISNPQIDGDSVKANSASVQGTTLQNTVILHGYTDGAEMYKEIVTSNIDNYEFQVSGSDLEAFGK